MPSPPLELSTGAAILTRNSTEQTDPGWSHHWRTGGPITLAQLASRWSHATGGRQVSTRAVPHDVGSVIVGVAALGDIVASKEFADRPKDREALPELRELQRRAGDR